ncbi:hypothetical protein Pmani_035457 [Petrolisthes manimaculis]|uniref:Uncharacterized protein n=1 Tax=Petrolisthes manimaculis TaxID=1843537 RepID=A0AAE1NKK7_9EUCA|nr:hypothetical protein Pmani_035457 [Petrolisthes manimaculis]
MKTSLPQPPHVHRTREKLHKVQMRWWGEDGVAGWAGGRLAGEGVGAQRTCLRTPEMLILESGQVGSYTTESDTRFCGQTYGQCARRAIWSQVLTSGQATTRLIPRAPKAEIDLALQAESDANDSG